MGTKKKAVSKTWTLGGERVRGESLTPAEERLFDETVMRCRNAAVQLRDLSPGLAQKNSAVRRSEQAARSSLGYFFQYFDGKYRRLDVVEALAAASSMPGPGPECCGVSGAFMLGAALWFLDDAKRRGLGHKLRKLLPAELDDDIDFVTPEADDLTHSRDDMLGLTDVFLRRKGDRLRTFRKILDLVDRETAAGLRAVFREALLDYLDRLLEVRTRVKSAGDTNAEERFPLLKGPPLPGPFFHKDPLPESLLEYDPARDRADVWFLLHTPMLVGAPSEEVQNTLRFRRSARLLEEFEVREPCAVCAAYLLLEREGDALANLNTLTANVLICAERHLPWGAGEAYNYAEPSENGRPDCSLRYAYHPHENAEEEDLPCPDIGAGERLSESQLFYLATGYALPRDEGPSRRLRDWFLEQGLPEVRAEALSWGAWLLFYVDELRAGGGPGDFGEFLRALDAELRELAEGFEAKSEDRAAQAAELARQLKASRASLHEAEQDFRRLQERLRVAEADALRDRAELSQLRETLYALKAKEERPEETPAEPVGFPWPVRRRIAVFGGHDTWRKAIRPLLPGVRFFDREMMPDVNAVRNADVIWIQANAMSHKVYYRIIDTARKENIPVRYFAASSARKCAEQLVLDELSAEEG